MRMISRAAPLKLLGAALACMLVLGLVPLASYQKAPRAWAADGGYLEVGASIPYAGYSTNWMWIDGAPAFCATPARTTPANGTYEKHDVMHGSTAPEEAHSDMRALIRAVLYYGWGGPGFDPELWPATWYDGGAMTDERYVALEHIIIADLYSYQLDWAVYGCSPAFKEWVRYNVTGFLSASERVPNFESTVRYRMMEKAPAVPNDFEAFIVTAGSSQGVISFELEGSAQIRKASAVESITDENSLYSLEGARYGIFRDESCTDEVAELVTDAEGTTESVSLPAGTYYAKEKEASPGFRLDETIHRVSVEAGETTSIESHEPPLFDALGVAVAKVDAETGKPVPQGDAALALAEFTFQYYDGMFPTAEEATASGAPTRTWVMRTDESGRTNLTHGDDTFSFDGKTYPYFVSGDAFYRDADERIVVPLGTVVITETEPPAGYRESDAAPIVVQFVSQGSNVVRKGDFAPVPEHKPAEEEALVVNEPIMRGDIAIEKRDAESQLLTPLGGASLDGTTFAITNRSAHAVAVDGALFEPNTICKTIAVEDGIAQTRELALPFGSYSIQEVAAGDGYLASDVEERRFRIEKNGSVVMLGADKEPDKAAYNQVKRGDLEFVKAHEATQERLAGIPFKITSHTTGEAHVIVTDANGEAKTSSDWNAHTANTNANDAALLPNGTVDEGKLDPAAGIWFGTTKEGEAVSPDNELGALPYDSYRLEELPVQANRGLQLIELSHVVVSRDGYRIDLGTFDNQPLIPPSISTVARDGADGDKQVIADTESIIIDRVNYANAIVGEEYELEAQLYDKTAGSFVGGDEPLTASTTFHAEESAGYAEVAFGPFNTLGLVDHDIVVFETMRLTDADRTVVAQHQDENDYDQTVGVKGPRIATSATDAADGDRNLSPDPASRIVDAISYRNLVPGASYVAVASVVLAEDGASPSVPSAPGETSPLGNSPTEEKQEVIAEIAGETTFTPEESHGIIEVPLEADTASLAGRSIVVYEKVFRINSDGTRVEVATHQDPHDPAQTLTIVEPRLSSSAADRHDGDKTAVAEKTAALVDTVTYQGLNPGRTYEIRGNIVEKNAYRDAFEQAAEKGESREDAHRVAFEASQIMRSDGSPATSISSFTPEEGQGSIEMHFELDSTELADKTLVVFEELFLDGTRVASHVAIDDQNQSISVEETTVSTAAFDQTSSSHEVTRDENARIGDRVDIGGLKAGASYTLVGIAIDKSTGIPLASSPERQSAYAAANGVGAASGGAAESDTAPAADFDGLAPGPSTEKDRAALFSAFVAIWEGSFQPDEDGRLRTTFATPGSFDEAAAQAALEIYDPRTFPLAMAQKTFTAEADTHTETMDIPLDTFNCAGREIVVYELLFDDGAGVLAAAHADLDDTAQTLTIAESQIDTEATDQADGDQTIEPSAETTIIDTVSYARLIPGEEYLVRGTLMDKASGEPLEINGEPVIQEKRFTPHEPSGAVEVAFGLDASALGGATVVVFEELFKEGSLVASHQDIDDESQSVTVGTPSELAPTGDNAPRIIVITLLATLAAGLLLGALTLSRRRRKALAKVLNPPR